MSDRSRNLLVPLAMLAVLASCGGEDPADPVETVEFDWGSILAGGDWTAGHAGLTWGEEEFSEVRLVDRRALGSVCAELEGPQWPSEFSFLRLRVPNLEAGTHRIVASGETPDFSGAQLQIVRTFHGGTWVPELEAVDGMVTITPGEEPERVTVAIDASFALGTVVGGWDDYAAYFCQDGESREVFECTGPGCCYGEKRLPFAITLESALFPEFAGASYWESRAPFCSRID